MGDKSMNFRAQIGLELGAAVFQSWDLKNILKFRSPIMSKKGLQSSNCGAKKNSKASMEIMIGSSFEGI